MTRRCQLISRLADQGFVCLEEDDILTITRNDWRKTYDWSSVTFAQVVDDFMAFAWDPYMS